jgi:hypothetical protein
LNDPLQPRLELLKGIVIRKGRPHAGRGYVPESVSGLLAAIEVMYPAAHHA